MLRQTQVQQDYGRRDSSNKPNNEFHRQNNRFFRKPYLEIDSTLESEEKQLRVGKLKHTFDTVIWALRVKNVKEHRFKIPWTVTALNCRPNIHFTNIGQTVPLRWRMHIEEPNECATSNLPDTTRHEYVKLLGFYYAKEKLADSCGVNNITLNPDETQQIYFLFTFPESEFAYIICPVEATWYDSEVLYSSANGAFLFLKIPGEYYFTIRFDWGKHIDVNGKRYKVKIDAWDNISMSRG